MIAALAIGSVLLVAEPVAAKTKAPVHKSDPCARLDAASNPSCADRMPPEQQVQAPSQPPPKAVNTPPPAAKAPVVNAPTSPRPQPRPAKGAAQTVKAPVPAKPAGPLDSVTRLMREEPILVGGASGLAVLLVVGVTVIGITRRTRHSETSLAPPGGSPPTRWRRDLVLTDQDGRDWRIDGAHLTPSAVVGSDPASELRRGDAGIAPRHVEFWVRDGRLMLRRLADPVFLNDRLLKDITPERVSTGDQLRLGSTTFTITID
jgi:hypothetical protein